jgi:hypothetical protein
VRIKNPNKAASSPSPVSNADKAALEAALVNLADKDPTFAELRAALPAGKRDRMTDGMLHQAALDLGLDVLGDDA